MKTVDYFATDNKKGI